jgi:hypothetical protein
MIRLDLSLAGLSHALAQAVERQRGSQSSPLLSCYVYSGTCGGCYPTPCTGLQHCYSIGYPCQGVHLDSCPSGFASGPRWWCCCEGELISCTDCTAGPIKCLCQGINYSASC